MCDFASLSASRQIIFARWYDAWSGADVELVEAEITGQRMAWIVWHVVIAVGATVSLVFPWWFLKVVVCTPFLTILRSSTWPTLPDMCLSEMKGSRDDFSLSLDVGNMKVFRSIMEMNWIWLILVDLCTVSILFPVGVFGCIHQARRRLSGLDAT